MARAFNEGNLALPMKSRILRNGVFLFSGTLIAGLLLAHSGLPASYRLGLFLPFLAATYAIHLGLYGTCGFMAARGIRATEQGVEPVADKADRCKLRDVGFRVMASSAITAIVATGVLAYGTV